jgi:hypothetical protein
METMTYEEYLPLRGEKIEPDKLIPEHTYYIEKNNEPENRRTVYRGIYLNTDPNMNSAIFNDKKGKSTIQFVVNPLKLKGEPFGFSIDPKWGNTFYTNSGEVNKNVSRLVYTLTGKRKNMIGPIPRGQTREMGIPIDVATIIALNLEDPHEISKTAKKIKSRKHRTSQSASKGGKKRTKKQRTKKH